MTPQESLVLARYVKACCPQQAMDEFTPDAWHDLLGDLDLQDCRDAVTAVARRQPFVAPAEIRAEVRRVRNERLQRAVEPAPPADAADEPGRYQRIIQGNVQRIADARDLNLALASGDARRSSEPTEEYLQARASLRPKTGPAADPREKAREQVEEFRQQREQRGGE